MLVHEKLLSFERFFNIWAKAILRYCKEIFNFKYLFFYCLKFIKKCMYFIIFNYSLSDILINILFADKLRICINKYSKNPVIEKTWDQIIFG